MTPEQMQDASAAVDHQFNALYNEPLSAWIRSGQAAKDAAAQDATDVREIDEWLASNFRVSGGAK